MTLAKWCTALELEVPVDRGDKTELRAQIRGPKGLMVLTS
jgi:hypothetical protein